MDVFLREFGQEAGKRIGNALAEESHRDPEVRRTAATGVGVGVVAAASLIGLLTE